MIRRLHFVQCDFEIAGGDDGIQQRADGFQQLPERGLGLLVSIHRQVVELVGVGKGQQRARHAQQFLVQPLWMELRVMQQVGQCTERRVDGVQQPERCDVARTELDDVLRRLPMQAVKRINLGLQCIQYGAQLPMQVRRGLHLGAGRNELIVQFETTTGSAPDTCDGHGGVGVPGLVLGEQFHGLVQIRQFRLRSIGEQIPGDLVRLPIACKVGSFGIDAVVVVPKHGQGKVDHGGLHAGWQFVQRDGIGQAVMRRRVVALSIREYRR
ncbi:hypothetical protein D3C81_733090 [compost metagenome]